MGLRRFDKSKCCLVGGQAGWRPREELQFESKGVYWQNSFFLKEGQSLLRFSTVFMRPSTLLKVMCLPKSTNLIVNLIQKTPFTEISRIFDQISGYPGPDKMTNTINHHITSLDD